MTNSSTSSADINKQPKKSTGAATTKERKATYGIEWKQLYNDSIFFQEERLNKVEQFKLFNSNDLHYNSGEKALWKRDKSNTFVKYSSP